MGLLSYSRKYTATKGVITNITLPMSDVPLQNLSVWIDSLGVSVNLSISAMLGGVTQAGPVNINRAAFDKVYHESGIVPQMANLPDSPPVSYTTQGGVVTTTTGYQLVLAVTNNDLANDAQFVVRYAADRGINSV